MVGKRKLNNNQHIFLFYFNDGKLAKNFRTAFAITLIIKFTRKWNLRNWNLQGIERWSDGFQKVRLNATSLFLMFQISIADQHGASLDVPTVLRQLDKWGVFQLMNIASARGYTNGFLCTATNMCTFPFNTTGSYFEIYLLQFPGAKRQDISDSELTIWRFFEINY